MWNHLQEEHTQEFRQAKASDESNGATGHTVNSKRSCLLPENVNMSVFLADNSNYINSTSQTIVILHFIFIYRISHNSYLACTFHKF